MTDFFSFHALTSVMCLSPWFYQLSDWLFKDHLVLSLHQWSEVKGLSKTRQDGISNGMAFFARNLQYLETPQYLRKQLVPVHKAGLGSLWICGWEIEVAVLLIEMKGNRSRVEGLIFDKGRLWIHLWSDFIMSSTGKFLSQNYQPKFAHLFPSHAIADALRIWNGWVYWLPWMHHITCARTSICHTGKVLYGNFSLQGFLSLGQWPF